jgi:hypothetical protein
MGIDYYCHCRCVERHVELVEFQGREECIASGKNGDKHFVEDEEQVPFEVVEEQSN